MYIISRTFTDIYTNKLLSDTYSHMLTDIHLPMCKYTHKHPKEGERYL